MSSNDHNATGDHLAMTVSDQAVSSGGTTSSDYSSAYYDSYHSPGLHDVDYDWESPHWRTFFSGVADRLIGLVDPKTSLDVGCAKGMLVQGMVQGGVDARGFDISDDAITHAHADVKDRLFVSSATLPIEGRWDLITCTEVLEHLAPEDAQKAIDIMCGATDQILFSSSPADFEESTHINTNPTPQWAAWFAERGFYRRIGADVSFLAPWAILFERSDLTKRSIVERYESQYDPLARELRVKKQSLLESQRKLTESQRKFTALAGVPSVKLDDEAILARHDELRSRDNVMGLEATIATLQREVASLRKRTRKLRDNLEDKTAELEVLQNSRALKVGQTVTRPVRRMRR